MPAQSAAKKMLCAYRFTVCRTALAHPFPQRGLGLEAVELEAPEVAARDDADDCVAPGDDRQVAKAAVGHGAQGVDIAEG